MNKENCALKLVEEIILDMTKLTVNFRNFANVPKITDVDYP